MKECPNPTCRAHQEHWGFEDIENFCPVCRERLVTDEAAAVAPTNVMAAQAAATNRPYIDSYMEVRSNNTTPIGLFVAVLAAAIILLLLFLLISSLNQPHNSNNAAATLNQQSAYATGTAAIVSANATETALAAADVPITNSGTVLPSPYATGVSGGSGGFPTATAAPVVENTPIPLAQGGAALIHNIGMVASCTNSALKPSYLPTEHFFVMVQADFSRTQVYEIHALWQMPPNYSTVIDARGDAMSIDNSAPGLKLRDGGMYYVCFQAIPPTPQNVWPVGNYRVDIYINNGALPVVSKDFTVGQ